MNRIGVRVFFLAACLASLYCSQPSAPPPSQSPAPATGSVVEKDPALKSIVPADARIEKLADGFAFTEGPIWIKEGGEAVMFSDIPNNRIMKWKIGRASCRERVYVLV